jgi:hypothetical protein
MPGSRDLVSEIALPFFPFLLIKRAQRTPYTPIDAEMVRQQVSRENQGAQLNEMVSDPVQHHTGMYGPVVLMCSGRV